jgi:DNA-binding beta-propeller fold protein YncE
MFVVLLAQPSGASASPGLLAQLVGANGCIAQGTDATCVNNGRGLDGGSSVVVSPDGKNAYLTANGSSAIAIFDRNPSTGALTQKAGAAGCITNALGDVTCDTSGRGIGAATTVTISPDGKNAYAAGFSSDAVAIFDRDPVTGALTQKAGAAGCITLPAGDATCTTTGRALDGAYWVTVSPDGENVYVASQFSDGVAIFDRDTGTGALTQKAGAAGCIVQGTDATCTNDGRGLDFARGIELSPDGKSVYVASQQYGYLAVFDRDLNTGALTQKAGAEGCITGGGGAVSCNTGGRALLGAMSVAVSPDNGSVYVAAQNSSGVAIFDRDTGTGSLTQKSGAAGCIVQGTDATCTNDGRGLGAAYWVALSADGQNAYVAAGGVSAKSMAIFGRDRVPACQPVGGVAVGHDKTTSIALSCTDPIGAPTTYSVVTPPAHGTLGTIDQAGAKVSYTPAAGYSGPDSFTYKATARGFDSQPVTVSLDVAPLPEIFSLKVSPKTFRAARSGPSASARAPRGATVSFDLNRAATVTFTVQRVIKGRKRGNKCSATRRRGKRCTIYRTYKGSFSRDGAAGENSFRFSGRLSGKPLPPGQYRLVGTPRADDVDGEAARATFRIVR